MPARGRRSFKILPCFAAMNNYKMPGMETLLSSNSSLQTPALIYDEQTLLQTLAHLAEAKKKLGIHILYSIKALSHPVILDIIARNVDGFSASSLFEAMLSRKILGNKGSVHITTPAIAEQEISGLLENVDYISFNSLSQWDRFQKVDWKEVHLGLRVNPQLSFVKDERYDPCRTNSKLGIPMSDLLHKNLSLEKISGIHFHTNCDALNLNPLLETVMHVSREMDQLPLQLDWMNLGGGYLFDEIRDWDPLAKAVEFLTKKRCSKIFIEPGEAVVGHSGYLASTVLDVFESDGKKIAIIDSTINHMPQFFEYQYKPTILESRPQEKFSYVIAGRTCLAGDLYGQYCFPTPLEIGSRITFASVGAYTLVKSNMFNGINLPNLYLLTATGKLVELRKFSFQDFW
ncbi:MAG: 2Fe-2S ferredoxin, partial [Acidobacteria bacterium]